MFFLMVVFFLFHLVGVDLFLMHIRILSCSTPEEAYMIEKL